MRSLISYDPLTDTGADEMFRGFFKPVRWEKAPAPVMIKMDVAETANGYLVHAEMPGAGRKTSMSRSKAIRSRSPLK